jgi:hypothetical protein
MALHMTRVSALLITILASTACSRTQPPDVAQNEKKFQEMMTGATLVGTSTRLNKEGTFGPERYTIEKVSKISGDTWLFQTRMKFGSHDLPLPLPLTVKWAGDTPVITLTDLAIPGVGTFTARVLLYGDQYAGTWSGKSEGGQLFGKIVHEK